MKLSTLSSAVIVAALTVGVLAPTTALAQERELDSTGTVIVTEGGGEEVPGVIDPENPEVPIDPVDPPVINPDLGSLMIEAVTNLEFGEIQTSANEVKTYANPVALNNGEARGSIVQWRDIRSGGTFGYTITADLTQQFTGSSGNSLNGATIDYSNGFAVADASNTNTEPSLVAPAFQLSESGGAQTVVTADRALEEGKGRFVMAFGDSRENTDANSVQLTVPAATASNMAVDTYTAKVTWKITAAA
ncbi:WxL domain-containing protein [Enterococcus sp. 5H]|uniref:WxL domain-containing protein n=1 Tax=Enterococcus sp. 5H TaxID=1229490 RepID=UPI0023049543|nr:WxL domain-containing protein [Enterococcus sp. 5H]MDA9472834.1 LPXTG-motif-containing cell wall surface anchor protein [Enterococcus sp. 5H]